MRNKVTVEPFCGTHELRALDAGTIFQFVTNTMNENCYMVLEYASVVKTITTNFQGDGMMIVHLNTGNMFWKLGDTMVDVIRTPIKLQRV